MIRSAPVFVLVLVTLLLLGYGAHPWSWLAGPIAALAVWSLDRKTDAPPLAGTRPRPARRPAPVD